MIHGEVTVPAVYEHVAKFMEENGLHVPLGDALSIHQKPATLLECIARTGPYGDTLKQWWRGHVHSDLVKTDGLAKDHFRTSRLSYQNYPLPLRRCRYD